MISEQYTVRLYTKPKIGKIESSFKKCRDLFSSKSDFLAECILRGVEDIEEELFGEKRIFNVNELYLEIRNTQDKLNKLITLSEKSAKENIANLTVNQKLLSCNYNMLSALSKNTPCDEDEIEGGLFDELPERLNSLLEDLLKALFKK